MSSSEDDTLERYNYPHFVPESFEPLMRFDEGPAVGTKAPSFPLWRLEDRQEIPLSAVLKENLYTVVEFGSFT